MKRFFKALPVVLVGGLALTGCSATETPSANSGVTITVTTHADSEALSKEAKAVAATAQAAAGAAGSAAQVPVESDVLGVEALNTVAFLKQLGITPTSFGLKSESSDGGKKRNAELTLEGVDLASLTKAQAAAQEQVAGITAQWKVSNPGENLDAMYAKLETLAGASALAVAHALPVVDESAHSVTVKPALVPLLNGHNTEIEVTLPGNVGELTGPAGAVTASGHEMVMHADKMEEGKATTASYSDPAPVMSWWLSTVLWILGVIVTVLIAVIALMPGKRKPQADEKTA